MRIDWSVGRAFIHFDLNLLQSWSGVSHVTVEMNPIEESTTFVTLETGINLKLPQAPGMGIYIHDFTSMFRNRLLRLCNVLDKELKLNPDGINVHLRTLKQGMVLISAVIR